MSKCSFYVRLTSPLNLCPIYLKLLVHLQYNRSKCQVQNAPEVWLPPNFFFQIARRGKHILPVVARACLVSTFFEDGVRMWTQWNEQREYMDISWGCGWFLATLFVVINLIGQLGGVVMVMGRLKVEIACGILFFIVVLQVRHTLYVSMYLLTMIFTRLKFNLRPRLFFLEFQITL